MDTHEIGDHLVMARDELQEARAGLEGIPGPLAKILLVNVTQAYKMIGRVMEDLSELEKARREKR